MVDNKIMPAGAIGIAPVLTVLETQLIELDRMGAAIAAAKLDAAIQQLRSDLLADDSRAGYSNPAAGKLTTMIVLDTPAWPAKC